MTAAERARARRVPDLTRDMLAVLTAAQDERPKRQALVGGEPGWVAYEIHVMHVEVDRIRAMYGLPPVDPADIARVDRQACGHSDYSLKFALYCAELALGLDPRRIW